MNTYFRERIIFILVILSLILISCTPETNPAPVDNTATSVPTTDTSAPPKATPVPLSKITLEKGDLYFTVDGRESVLFTRNMAGWEVAHYNALLDLARRGGSKMVRIQIDSMGTGMKNAGEIDEAWARKWERVFDLAAAKGLNVLIVFTGWYDWNNGVPDIDYSTWNVNTFNAANGGPAAEPGELFVADSSTQTMWLEWLRKVVTRWQGYENIAVWEIFSEINIASGAPGQTAADGGVSKDSAVDFTEKAVKIVHEADPRDRPVTLSLAGTFPPTDEWSEYLASAPLDLIQIHPYIPELDRELIKDITIYQNKYHKPIMIGESGLNDPETEENAPIGIGHAIWAGLVSGSMNARALYTEDGFAIFFPDLGDAFLEKYAEAELSAVRFADGVDFSGFQPLDITTSVDVWGGVIGNEKMALGWFRDAQCEPPKWNLLPVISGQTVTIEMPGTAAEWKVDFYDTRTGTDIIGSTTVMRENAELTIPLPNFQDDIAFKMTAIGGTVSTPAKVNTDPIAGKWSGTISNNAGTFSTPVQLEIQPGCEPGKICGTFSAPQLSCAGNLFLQEIAGEVFVLIEQNVTGADSCMSGGYEYLQLQPDGMLNYRFAFTPESAETSRGILQHP